MLLAPVTPTPPLNRDNLLSRSGGLCAHLGGVARKRTSKASNRASQAPAWLALTERRLLSSRPCAGTLACRVETPEVRTRAGRRGALSWGMLRLEFLATESLRRIALTCFAAAA